MRSTQTHFVPLLLCQSLGLGRVNISGAIHPSFTGFNGLESLSIELHPQKAHMYDTFSSSCLKSLNIAYYPADPSLSLNDTCERWTRSFPSLRSIGCTIISTGLWEDHNREALTGALSPLFSLPTIFSVRLGLHESQLTVHDVDIRDIGLASARYE
ncbi:hypothetical protein L226DRAFT_571921 [Lentinus tigrinus ALCF2SS1-7]|uniref:Uncharacterized protein n=1 Tax=Lentinus tigrinus ALCF2SS1-6 TaxID=1328759 RepID=A0A5C2RYD3_9APHY|nr:hypothetical protein L227DRAFT_614725 [Lentinus tigrinus ALCF2SS1-6]RPD74043.1 hypothetical protein L226DRAFT_571921 [Lentinus tigrinus ALCF2SS1-7]